VRVVWNTILTGVVYEHASVESLRRELLRNGQLRQICGLEVERGTDDVSFGFEQHYIRGLKKMKLCCSIALCVMRTMGFGRIKEEQKDYMRNLVKAG
jgi:hypothetical protein